MGPIGGRGSSPSSCDHVPVIATAGLFFLDLAACAPEQDAHVAADDTRESLHRGDCDVLVAGLDLRNVLLGEARTRRHLSLAQPGLEARRPQVPPENSPQIIGNGITALGRFPQRMLHHSHASRGFYIFDTFSRFAIAATAEVDPRNPPATSAEPQIFGDLLGYLVRSLKPQSAWLRN